MKLYGAKITQQYIQYNDNKKRHRRYPESIEYPREAIMQEKYGYVRSWRPCNNTYAK